MVAKDRPKNMGSPKGAVGEIDTSAPFQSVKDAVNLFGEGAFSGSGEKPAIKKTKAFSAERVLAKETQLHLVQKELNKLKDQIKNAETTKARALSDLEKAKKTVEDLTGMLKVVSVSKDSAVKATEAAESHVKQIDEARNCDSGGTHDSQKPNLGTLGKEYVSAIAELDAAKKELWRIRHDYGASEEAKTAAVKQAVEAELAAKEYLEKAGELSNEISAVGESIEQVKLANLHTLEEEAKLYAEKDLLKQSYKTKLEESAKKLIALKEAIDPVLIQNLESRLQDTESQVDHVRKDIENTRNSDVSVLKSVTMELDDAKKSLQKVTEEEITICKLLEMLKVELEDVKKEHAELKVKDAETETVAGNLHVKLRKAKSELEAALAEESKIQGASLEMISTLHSLSTESELARHDAEETKKQAEELKKEAESNRTLLETAEEKLNNALIEAEGAKAAEVMALEQVKALSDRTNAARASTSDSGDQITISKDEYESLSGKVNESEKLAEMKVAAAMAQVEAVKASENEALKKLESTRKEIEDMKAATQEALKRAEMAEAAKKAVEGELRRWREREQKKLAEAAARILAENDASMASSSPLNYRVEKQQNRAADKVAELPKLERAKTTVSRKVLMPSISGIFVRKKNQVKGGSPSLIPG